MLNIKKQRIMCRDTCTRMYVRGYSVRCRQVVEMNCRIINIFLEVGDVRFLIEEIQGNDAMNIEKLTVA